MTAPESSEPQPDPEDDAQDPERVEPAPPSEPTDAVPDTLPEDWTDTPAAEEPHAGEDPADDDAEQERDVDALQDYVEELEGKLESAERRTDELLGVSRRQAAMADELHAENQKLRDGEVAQAVAPLVRNAARIADELAVMLESRPDDPDLAHVARRLSELLHDAGVTSVVPAAGDAFDPRTHQAAGATPTEEQDEDRCVAEVRRPGLVRDDGRVLRPAEVVVFRFTPPPQDDPDEGASS